MNDLDLVETVDRFGEGIVITVADTSERRLYASFCQPLGVPDGHVLNAPVRMVHEPAAMNRTPIMKCLFKGIVDKARMCPPARPPANDAPGKDVDHKGHVDETQPGRGIGEVRNPQPVWCWSFELAVYPVKRARAALSENVVRTGCPPMIPYRLIDLIISRAILQRAMS